MDRKILRTIRDIAVKLNKSTYGESLTLSPDEVGDLREYIEVQMWVDMGMDRETAERSAASSRENMRRIREMTLWCDGTRDA